MSWRTPTDIANRVRNMVRRGYLLSTDDSGKLLRGRVKIGQRIENDAIDIIHPVGFVGRVPAGERTEVLTIDVGGDPSRRVVLAVIGDRDQHPKVAEGEAVLYSPGDPKKFVRIDKVGGVKVEGDDQPVSVKTAKSIDMDAGEPINMTTPKTLNINAGEGASLFGGAIQVDADGNITITTNLTISGNLTVGGNINVGGVVIAEDFIER